MSLLFVSLLAAQSAHQRFEGRLISSSSTETLWLEVYEGNGRMLIDRVPVSRDGAFSVHAASAQLYELRVVTSHGERIFSEHTSFHPGSPVELRMPKSLEAPPPPAGPISLLRLSHKPAKQAMRLAREAQSLAGRGEMTAAVDRLRRATENDPRWFEAWNNLGSRYISAGQYAEAVTAFRTAISIDPNDAIAHSNLGLAHLFLRQPAEAEVEAGRSLQLDPGSTRAAYVAGLALLQQNKDTDVAIATLRRAGTELPRALLAVAEWHCRHNDLTGCATELKTFLKTPRGPNHEAAEKWLKEVKSKLPR